MIETMSHGRIMDYVSRCCEGIRSHMVRHLPTPFGDRLSVSRFGDHPYLGRVAKLSLSKFNELYVFQI
jgi:hypothetical protein